MTALTRQFSDLVFFAPLKDRGATGNFEIMAWPQGRNAATGTAVALWQKTGQSQGHVKTDEDLHVIVEKIKALL